jgi:hypothetical protein
VNEHDVVSSASQQNPINCLEMDVFLLQTVVVIILPFILTEFSQFANASTFAKTRSDKG